MCALKPGIFSFEIIDTLATTLFNDLSKHLLVKTTSYSDAYS